MPLTKDDIIYCHDYHPYWLYDDEGRRQRNPECKGTSRVLLDLKNSNGQTWQQTQDSAVRYFVSAAEKEMRARVPLPPTTNIVVVPSSKKDMVSLNLERVAQGLATLFDFKFVKNGLIRTVTVPSAHDGGVRSIPVHIDSIVVSHALPRDGNTVLLLDDVTTTGSTILACKELLKTAGFNHVVPLALCQSVRT